MSLKKAFKFFKKYYWEISVLLSILFFIFLIIFYKQISEKLADKSEEDFKLLFDPLWKRNYARIGKKNETKVREIFEKIFDRPFSTIRPNFLRNYKTGKNLELDGYNKDLKLAFEYQGRQHYEFCPFFHRTKDDFIKQLEHDKYKLQACQKEGIKLIVIPFLIKSNEMESYIRTRLRELNYL